MGTYEYEIQDDNEACSLVPVGNILMSTSALAVVTDDLDFSLYSSVASHIA